jgi:hypothetical protein
LEVLVLGERGPQPHGHWTYVHMTLRQRGHAAKRWRTWATSSRLSW